MSLHLPLLRKGFVFQSHPVFSGRRFNSCEVLSNWFKPKQKNSQRIPREWRRFVLGMACNQRKILMVFLLGKGLWSTNSLRNGGHLFRVFWLPREKKTNLSKSPLCWIWVFSLNSVSTVWSGEGKRNYPKKKRNPPDRDGSHPVFKHWIQVMKGLKSV